MHLRRCGLLVAGLVGGLLTGCGTVLDPGVAGSGRIVEAEPPVDELTGLQVGSAFDVSLTPGPEPAVLIRADDNVIDMVTAEVTGGVLRIGLDGRARNATLEAEVTVPPDGLASIDLDGAATATATDPVTDDSVEITADGASRAFLVVSAQEVTVKANGASTVNLTGEASELTASADGASTIAVVELPVTTAEVDAGGASTVELTVTGELTARAGGASTIRYSGSPDEVDKQTGGASTISPAD
jgi:hypothetical protein